MKHTKDHILEITLHLLKEKGYREVSLQEICDSCGITKGTFYYHFKAKDDLIHHYYHRLGNGISEIYPAMTAQSDYKEKLWIYTAYWIDHLVVLGPEILKAFFLTDLESGFPHLPPLVEDVPEDFQSDRKLLLTLIRQGQEHGNIRAGHTPELLLRTFIAALAGLSYDWACRSGAYDEKKEIRHIFDVIF